MKRFSQRSGATVPVSDDQFYASLLAFMCVAVAGAAAYTALTMHRNFLSVACDTAEFQNTIVNTLHGHWFRDTVIDGPNLLGMHTLFIFVLLAPAYIVFPYPEVLFVTQICGVYATVMVLYFTARNFTSSPLMAFLVAASALASPIMIHMALAPFHPETWIAAAVFGTYNFYRRNKPLACAICFAIGLTSGEMAAFIFLALGLGLFWGEDGVAWCRRYGLALGLCSVAWLVLSLAVISPSVRVPEQQNLFAYHYKQWNVTSGLGLLLAAARQPLLTLQTLFEPSRWFYLLTLIGPVILGIFASRTSFLIVLLIFPIYFLMDSQEFFLYFHAYYYTFVFVAGYLGLLSYLRARELDRTTTMIFSGLYCLNAILLVSAMAFYFQVLGGEDDAFSATLRDAFAHIPPDAAVYGPHRYSAYLSSRPDMVMGDLVDMGDDFDAFVEQKFPTTTVHGASIDYIVSDFYTDQCGWRQGFMNAQQQQARAAAVDRLLASKKWKVFWQENDAVILQRVE